MARYENDACAEFLKFIYLLVGLAVATSLLLIMLFVAANIAEAQERDAILV